MGLQEEEEVIKERSPIAERIWSNGRSIQEDWCGTYTERSGVGPRRENGVGLMRKTAVRD